MLGFDTKTEKPVKGSDLEKHVKAARRLLKIPEVSKPAEPEALFHFMQMKKTRRSSLKEFRQKQLVQAAQARAQALMLDQARRKRPCRRRRVPGRRRKEASQGSLGGSGSWKTSPCTNDGSMTKQGSGTTATCGLEAARSARSARRRKRSVWRCSKRSKRVEADFETSVCRRINVRRCRRSPLG